MSGIYIHIPYCKQACHYCDFHFSTNLKTKESLLCSIIREIVIRKSYLGEASTIRSIYFGGGTPSILEKEELKSILEIIFQTFNIEQEVEITLEANPDDLSPEKIKELYSIGFNRLSIGIQSFDDDILSFFNRAHTRNEAIDAVEVAQNEGFDNISIDLIFGVPEQSIDQLAYDLEKAIELGTQHISIYGLTIEDNTVFGRWYKQKKLTPIDEDLSAQHLTLIMDRLEHAGYQQYEISNFCKAGFESKHNSSYWQNYKYLGVGPSAHSYDGSSRQFNISNNIRYAKAVLNNETFFEKEILSAEDKINEYILTHIRTISGISLTKLREGFDYDIQRVKSSEIKMLLSQNVLIQDGDFLRLTRNGRLIGDFITEKLIL